MLGARGYLTHIKTKEALSGAVEFNLRIWAAGETVDTKDLKSFYWQFESAAAHQF